MSGGPLSITRNVYRPLDRWNNDYIAPGNVGSVGDVHMQPRLKHSNPDMPLRWERAFAGKNEKRLGSNVQNGTKNSFQSGGGPAKARDTAWEGDRQFKTQVGWRYQDLRAPDVLVEPYVSSLGDYSWRNRIAKVVNAKATGSMFMPLPGGYSLPEGAVPRGGLTPELQVGDETGMGTVVTNPVTGNQTRQNYPDPILPNGQGGNVTRAGPTNLGVQSTSGPQGRIRPGNYYPTAPISTQRSKNV
jgi:hypothetical protein